MFAGSALRRVAIAAALILVATSVTTLYLRRAPQPAAVPPSGPATAIDAAAALNPDVAAAEADFTRATASLLEVLRARGRDLPPEALQAIEANLRIVDQAISDARAALKRDPSNARLGRIVTATYQMKADLLRGAARIPSPV
jgi:hypothetical protein